MLLVLGVLLAGGCAGPASTPGHARGVDTRPRPLGLEARWWRVAAVGGALYRALAPFAVEDATPGPWRDAGIRFVRLPRDAVDPIESALPHIDAIRHAALGRPTTWTPLASASLSPGQRIAAPDGERGSGRVELLVRGWPEPAVRGGVLFRVELALAWSPPGPGSARPEVLGPLLFSRSIEEGGALVIVAAPPGDDFMALGEPISGRSEPEPGLVVDPTPPAGDVGVTPLPAPAVGGGGDGVASTPAPTVGPGPPAPDPIGEVLFVTPALFGDHPSPAVLDALVLIPGRG